MLVPLRVEKLRGQIRHHDHLYYTLNQPTIPDAEYDRLFAELVQYERDHPDSVTPDSPTQRVAGQASPSFAPVVHQPPMLSLDNAFDFADFEQWHDRTGRLLGMTDFPMSVEYKIDGVAITLSYQDGCLINAATRGDGRTGEDVTINARTIRTLPLAILNPQHLPYDRVQVRGEVYMPKSALAFLNEARLAEGEDPYANTRNAASGAIRNHQPEEARRRRLSVWTYDLALPDDRILSHHERMTAVRQAGFPVEPNRYVCTTVHEVLERYNQMLDQRDGLDFDADGIVIKVDDLDMRRQLGQTGHAPRWAIAWKFPAQRATTTLSDIEISVGRFGKLTPVAKLEPVHIDGVTVQSASLHNEEDIRRKDIRIGDEVYVERAGGVIPHVLGPVDDNPERSTSPFKMPERCPVCSQPVQNNLDEAAHWCDNDACGNRPLAALKHFVSKDAMNVDGLGPKWCELLIKHALVDHPADIYSLTEEQLLTMPRMGAKLANRILANIESSKDQAINRSLYALGIYRLGHHVSEMLAEHYSSLDEIMALTYDELINLPDVSHVIASSIIPGFRKPRIRQTVAGMKAAGVTLHKETIAMAQEQQPAHNRKPWEGMNFVVTGKLADYTRDEVHTIIASMGGSTASRVTKTTTHLVFGDKPGSKYAQAEKVGAQCWSEAEFLTKLASVQ